LKAHGSVVLASMLAACGSSPLPAPTVYDDGDQNAAQCPVAPAAPGTRQEGARCADAATDCAPTCCECTSVADSYWASECNDGVCTSGQQACDDAPSSTLCVVTNTIYDDGNQGAPACPNPPNYTGQPGQPGAACTDAAADCSPACCQCTSGANSYWASECSGGVCTPDSQACGDAPSSTLCVVPATIYDDGSQGAPACPNPPNYTGQPGQPGAACTDAAADCSPACCQCTSGDNSFWASECSGGFCTSYSQACDDAPSSTLCQ
jgi:hypothetical protein